MQTSAAAGGDGGRPPRRNDDKNSGKGHYKERPSTVEKGNPKKKYAGICYRCGGDIHTSNARYCLRKCQHCKTMGHPYEKCPNVTTSNWKNHAGGDVSQTRRGKKTARRQGEQSQQPNNERPDANQESKFTNAERAALQQRLQNAEADIEDKNLWLEHIGDKYKEEIDRADSLQLSLHRANHRIRELEAQGAQQQAHAGPLPQQWASPAPYWPTLQPQGQLQPNSFQPHFAGSPYNQQQPSPALGPQNPQNWQQQQPVQGYGAPPGNYIQAPQQQQQQQGQPMLQQPVGYGQVQPYYINADPALQQQQPPGQYPPQQMLPVPGPPTPGQPLPYYGNTNPPPQQHQQHQGPYMPQQMEPAPGSTVLGQAHPNSTLPPHGQQQPQAGSPPDPAAAGQEQPGQVDPNQVQQQSPPDNDADENDRIDYSC